ATGGDGDGIACAAGAARNRGRAEVGTGEGPGGLDGDGDVLGHSGVHQIGVGVVGAPLVGGTVGTAGGHFDEEPGLNAPAGGRVGIVGSELEVFYQYAAGGELPVSGGIEAHRGAVRNRGPAALDGAVGPEWCVERVWDEFVA